MKNARLGRIAAGGALLAIGPGLLALQFGDSRSVLYLAAVVLRRRRRPEPAAAARAAYRRRRRGHEDRGDRAAHRPGDRGRGPRAASGFLLFALAFALQPSGQPTWWFAVLAGSATAGGSSATIAPKLPANLREEAVVIGCLIGAGIGATFSFFAFELPVLVVFALVVGASSELGRLAFQTLMQRSRLGGAHGRVFVRYEVAFQLAWVVGR